MKTLTYGVLIILLGLLIITNREQLTVSGNQENNQPNIEGTESRKDFIEVDHLPEAVLKTLEKDYKGWNPSLAIVENNGIETFFEVELVNQTKSKTKLVTLTINGEVIGEEETPIRNDRHQDEHIWYIHLTT